MGGADKRLDLPPGYTAVPLREKDDAFAHAVEIAAREGAGTLVWVPRFDTIEFALVLEPDEPLAAARRVLYPIMSALGDAIASHCPPERPLTFSWPDTIMLDRGIIGGMRLAWPQDCAEDAVPDWLVAGAVLRTLVANRRTVVDFLGQGNVPIPLQLDERFERGNTLQSDDFEMMPAETIIGSFCRHFLVHLDQWHEKGFTPVAQSYLARLPEEHVVRRGIDVNGDLLVRTLKAPTTPERQLLLPALAVPQWRDPETGEPWL